MTDYSKILIGVSVFCLTLVTTPASSAGKHYARTVDEADRSVNSAGLRRVQSVQSDEGYTLLPSGPAQEVEVIVVDVGKKLGPVDIGRISDEINAVYRLHRKQLRLGKRNPRPLRVRLLPDRAGYVNYLSALGLAIDGHGTAVAESNGIYLYGDNQIVLPLGVGVRTRFYARLRHEAIHSILGGGAASFPVWLEEGLAENMETLKTRSNKSTLEPHRENKEKVIVAVRDGNLLNAEELLGGGSERYHRLLEENYSMLQAQAGEMVRMLLSSRTGNEILIALLRAHARSGAGNSARALEQIFDGGLEQLQIAWEKWTRRPAHESIAFY